MEENPEVEEDDVDIESEFLLEKDELRAENVAKTDYDIAANNRWMNQAVHDDMDSDSKEMILRMLECDEAAASTHPTQLMSTHKTSEAMKKTSRRHHWSHEDKALFETGVEIYGRSWKDIAELLPHKTLSQVTSYGIQYFKKNKGLVLLQPPDSKQQRVSSQQTPAKSAPPRQQLTPVHPLISNAEIHRLEECDSDEEVDIMSDGSENDPADKSNTMTCTAVKAESGLTRTTSPVGVDMSLTADCDSREAGLVDSLLCSQTNSPPLALETFKSAEVKRDMESGTGLSVTDGLDRGQEKSSVGQDTTLSVGTTPSGSNHTADTQVDSPNSEATVDNTSTRNSAHQGQCELVCLSAHVEMHVNTLDADDNANDATSGRGNGAGEGPMMQETGTLEYYTPAELRLDYGVLNSNGELVPMPAPEAESQLDRNLISEQEKQVHFEFFENRANKTPERYLRIRNYILEQWLLLRPNYVNKTSIRTGLRQCGDVNCIGRIHAYLEQLGAINYGCVQAVYQRMALTGMSGGKGKPAQDQSSPSSNRTRKRRPAAPRNTYNGGSTHEHESDENMPSPPSKTSRSSSSKTNLDSFALISCTDFAHCDLSCPYRVVLESTAAAVMDIHSHLCKTEVIGLLGGSYSSEHGSLRVIRAEPCWSKSTSLHCDMDPVSQTQAGEMIRQAGLQVIGWYHSHPTFVPNPSQQDIESQQIFQKWFSKGGDHFLGVIVSPYNPASKTHNSELRCFTTAPTPTKLCSYYKTSSIPLKFDYKVETSADNTEIIDLVPKVSRLLDMYKHYQHTVDLLDTYRSSSDLCSLDKMLLSVESYLQTADAKILDRTLLLEDLRFVLTSYCEKTA